MSKEKVAQVLQVDQEFSIDLEAIPGAGYMWEVSDQPEELEILSRDVVSISKEIGGPSTQRFVIVARQPGNFSIAFELKRRWEKTSIKTKIFMIQAVQ
jgi:predicted secreted protein